MTLNLQPSESTLSETCFQCGKGVGQAIAKTTEEIHGEVLCVRCHMKSVKEE